MMNRVKRFLRRERPKVSYAQCGEDLIIDFIFESMSIKRPAYLDIGAHHPTFLSNTALFYKRGSSGVCIEPDPMLFAQIQRHRKRDVCMNVGVGVEHAREADFFVLTSRTLNTFSREEAEMVQSTQSFGVQRIEQVIKIPIVPINDILVQYFSTVRHFFVSLDVEGLDYEILAAIDLKRFRPSVVCVETLHYNPNGTAEKNRDIIDYMHSHDYETYADTYINTIFRDREYRR